MDETRSARDALWQGLAIAGLLAASQAALAVDEAAAMAVARQNNCFNCHTVAKKADDKDGPMYKEIAAKYKGKAEAEQRLITHLTTGEKAKFPDGHEEPHKIVKTKDQAELKNLVAWILSR